MTASSHIHFGSNIGSAIIAILTDKSDDLACHLRKCCPFSPRSMCGTRQVSSAHTIWRMCHILSPDCVLFLSLPLGTVACGLRRGRRLLRHRDALPGCAIGSIEPETPGTDYLHIDTQPNSNSALLEVLVLYMDPQHCDRHGSRQSLAGNVNDEAMLHLAPKRQT